MNWLARLQKAPAQPQAVQRVDTQAMQPQASPSAANDPARPPTVSTCWPHGDGWTDAEIDRFNGRMVVFAGKGCNLVRSEAMAERLLYRDRDGDDRRLCLECRNHASNGRCLAAGRGRIAGASTYLEPVATILQRCEGFKP